MSSAFVIAAGSTVRRTLTCFAVPAFRVKDSVDCQVPPVTANCSVASGLLKSEYRVLPVTVYLWGTEARFSTVSVRWKLVVVFIDWYPNDRLPGEARLFAFADS